MLIQYSDMKAVFFLILFFGFFILNSYAQDSELRTPITLDEEDVIISNEDMAILFSISIAVVIGLFVYAARGAILRKKTEYDKKDYGSKKDKDYEKYHSDWASDDIDFGSKTQKDAEFREAAHQSTLPDYYAVLGVSKNASGDEIKEKFRNLVKKSHPDKTTDPNAEKKMAEINKAYEVLSDKEKRKSYDKYYPVS